MSKLSAALVNREVFLPDITTVLTHVTEPLGHIAPVDKSIFYQYCLLT